MFAVTLSHGQVMKQLGISNEDDGELFKHKGEQNHFHCKKVNGTKY